MIGKILGFWLVNWDVIWSCINRSESCINLLVFVCMYVCSFLLPVQRSRRQSWDKFVINCFGVWYNLYLAIRRLYHPRLHLGWYSHLIARYKLYHTPKQLITNSTEPVLLCHKKTRLLLGHHWANSGNCTGLVLTPDCRMVLGQY